MGKFYTGIGARADYNVKVTEENIAGGKITDWKLISVISGSIVLGILVGILLGKKSVKKRQV